MQQGEVETVAFWRHRGHKFGSPAMVASTPSSAEWPVLHSHSFHLPTSQEAPRAGPGLCCSSLTLHGHGHGLVTGQASHKASEALETWGITHGMCFT